VSTAAASLPAGGKRLATSDVVQQFASVMAALVIIYAIEYFIVTSPSRFAPGLTIRQEASLTTRIVPLELPANEEALQLSLRLHSDAAVRVRQTALYWSILRLDQVFVWLESLQLLSVLLLAADETLSTRAHRAGTKKERLLVTGISAAAAALIGLAGVLHSLANRSIGRVLDLASQGSPTALASLGDLIGPVSNISTWRWLGWGICCLLVSVLPLRLKELRWMKRIGKALAIAGILACLGTIPQWHGLLPASLIFYGFVAVAIVWQLILKPPVFWADKKMESVVQRSWNTMRIAHGGIGPEEMTLGIYAGDTDARKYRKWSPVGTRPEDSIGRSDAAASAAETKREPDN
jgi:hypothetical protein